MTALPGHSDATAEVGQSVLDLYEGQGPAPVAKLHKISEPSG